MYCKSKRNLEKKSKVCLFSEILSFFLLPLYAREKGEYMQMAANISSWKILTAAQASASAHFSCGGGGGGSVTNSNSFL
jgi:hypothetical protein